MKIKNGMENKYKEWFDKNNDPYGRRCFTYAECWAELLESNIIDNCDIQKVIVDNAEECSRKADTDGITGFMYGMAISILSNMITTGNHNWQNFPHRAWSLGTCLWGVQKDNCSTWPSMPIGRD